jgi:septal ring factor EnvC (AmiA/AmiB activator)
MWRSLLQLRVLLPYVSRLLPLLDSGFAPAPDTRHFDQSVAEVQASHRELTQQVQDQSAHLKRVEEQLTKLRESIDRNAVDSEQITHDIRALGRTVRLLGGIAIALLVIVIGLVSFKLFY